METPKIDHKGATAIAMVILGTAIAVLVVDFKIKRDIIEAATSAHADLEKMEALAKGDAYAAKGKRGTGRSDSARRVRGDVHPDSDPVLVDGTSKLEASSTYGKSPQDGNGDSSRGSRQTVRRSGIGGTPVPFPSESVGS